VAETKQRRRPPSSSGTHTPKPNISRPRRTSTAKQSRFSRGWTFRAKPQPTGIKGALKSLTGSKAASKKNGAAAAGGLALLAGGLATLRKRREKAEAPAPGPVTTTNTQTHPPAGTEQPVTQDTP
jgi:LPXTG-motif cell wall-anchored protein